MKKIAVIGGGVSGIAAAYYLAKCDVKIDLYEAKSQLGGRIESRKMGDRWVDMGGKNIGKHYHHFREFIGEIGAFEFEHFGLNSAQQVGERVVTINKDKGLLYNAVQVCLRMGIKGLHHLVRFAYCIKQDRSQGFLNTSFFNRISERYDQYPLSHYLGYKTLDFLIRAVTVRMNGAEPDECYMGNLGSNLNLLLDSYEQIKGGMHQWILPFFHFSEKIDIHTDHVVQSIVKMGKKTRVKTEQKIEDYDHVVIALPAKRSAVLMAPLSQEISVLLNRVRYYPVAVAVVEYDVDIFTPETRAMVFSRSSPLSNAGAYGIEELNVVRYTFSGRTARDFFQKNTSEIQLIELAESCMAHHFDMRERKRKQYAYQYFDDGLCAYSPFHHKLLAQIKTLLPDGVTLIGDYWRGASIEACFRSAYEQTKGIV